MLAEQMGTSCVRESGEHEPGETNTNKDRGSEWPETRVGSIHTGNGASGLTIEE